MHTDPSVRGMKLLTHEGQASNAEGEAHGDGVLESGPLGLVVAGPQGAQPLAPGKGGPGEDEGAVPVGAVAGPAPLLQALPGGRMEQGSVDVVHLPVLHPTMVDVVLGHRHLPTATKTLWTGASHPFWCHAWPNRRCRIQKADKDNSVGMPRISSHLH